jgi:hypothetical protein
MIEEKRNRKKRLWVRDWTGRRDSLGASTLLLKELAAEDVNEYKICLRMTPEKFDAILVMVAPKIERQNTQNEGCNQQQSCTDLHCYATCTYTAIAS